jgi:hypothetical protein
LLRSPVAIAVVVSHGCCRHRADAEAASPGCPSTRLSGTPIQE